MRRSGRTTPFAFALLLCSVVFLCASSARAWTYHSFAHGYSICLPDDWVQVPEEVLAVRLSELRSERTSGRIDVAFQPKRNANWFEQPYLVVEVVDYRNLGYSGQVDAAQVEQIVQNTTGLDPANPYREDPQVLEGGAEVEAPDGLLALNANSRRFVWSSSTSDAKAGIRRMKQWGFFGRESLALLTLQEKDKGSDRLRTLAREVAGSFQFEVGRDYQAGMTLADLTTGTVKMLTTPDKGVVVTLLCVVVAVACAAYAVASNRRREMACRQYSPFDMR